MAGPGFLMPARRTNAEGAPRRVGVELEFAGVPLRAAARLVVDLFGGVVEERDRFRWDVTGTELGDFSLTVDVNLLQDRKYAGMLESIGLGGVPALERLLADTIELLTSPFVPFEIVTAPLLFEHLPRLEDLRDALREGRATGTGHSILHGFGMHLNPEAPDLESRTLRDHLRAFLLMAEWLRLRGGTDLTRRFLPFIAPFPEDYRRLVLAPGYDPGVGRFIDDYLEANPTRNRPLDLLPILAELDEDRVQLAVKEPELVSPRPAFHYRLPDCRIDEPGWTIAAAWNRWVRLERFAGDREQLEAASAAFLDKPVGLFGRSGADWARIVERWLGDG